MFSAGPMRSSQVMALSVVAPASSAAAGSMANSHTISDTSAALTNLTLPPTGTIIQFAPDSISATGTDQAGIAHRAAPGTYTVMLGVLQQVLAHLLQLLLVQALQRDFFNGNRQENSGSGLLLCQSRRRLSRAGIPASARTKTHHQRHQHHASSRHMPAPACGL